MGVSPFQPICASVFGLAVLGWVLFEDLIVRSESGDVEQRLRDE